MQKRNLHVSSRDGKWRVRRTGAVRASGIYATQQEAVAHAREIARHQRIDLFIHGEDGRIRTWDRYAGDPHPSEA